MSGPLIYVVAGEPSGDLLAGRLMAALKEATGGTVRFAGIGGETMAEQGLHSLFDMAELSIMGLAEVIPSIPKILRRLDQTMADIRTRQPDAIVTVDSWGFTGRIHKRLKACGSTVPRIHYVAPMVWAWKEGRARKLAGCLDLLMCLLPNEPAYFQPHGLRAVHVGHSVLESGADRGDRIRFRADHSIPDDAPVLCVLPGSRRSEVGRLLPVLGETVSLLAQRFPGLRVLLPTVNTVAATVEAAARNWIVPAVVVRGQAARYDAFAASDAAVAASGTVALELAMAGVPAVITYKANALTALLARRLLKIRYVNLVNILMDRDVVPERLQEQARPTLLADEVSRLLQDPAARRAQLEGAAEALRRLGQGGASPSAAAASLVLETIEARRRG